MTKSKMLRARRHHSQSSHPRPLFRLVLFLFVGLCVPGFSHPGVAERVISFSIFIEILAVMSPLEVQHDIAALWESQVQVWIVDSVFGDDFAFNNCSYKVAQALRLADGRIETDEV